MAWRTRFHALAAAPAAACAFHLHQPQRRHHSCAENKKTMALVLNSGSSSVKYGVFAAYSGPKGPVINMVAQGLVDKIGLAGCVIKHEDASGKTRNIEGPLADHGAALKAVANLLTEAGGPISKAEDIEVVGHRVVHGGPTISQPTIVDAKTDAVIEQMSSLAPLHNPPNLTGIRMGKEIFTKSIPVAVFDTAFHATMPPESYRYAIPKELYEKHHIRRYGFHGTSYKYVSQAAADMLGKPLEDCNFIMLHLGNGASMCAMKKGKCVDTTMGLTPLEGCVMGTRSGDVDCGVYTTLLNNLGMTGKEVDTLLNKKSGLLGVSGMSDMREVIAAGKAGNKDAALARSLYIERIRKYIGAFLVKLNGDVDAIIWTAGVGENDKEARELSLANLAKLGIEVDTVANRNLKGEGIISTSASRTKVMVIPTQEELCIVQQALELTGKMPK